ncbi:MAG: class I SAM-dependent methyltransferase [Lactococcus plantarum]|nr:class I SAM-dependent methyltransferase [Lactococcus plantarum]MDN6084920.1 class I SAM-dependent methyltransferase [Lactococcus plantarum]
MLRPLAMAHAWLEEIICAGDITVDATMGQGFDTAFLASLGSKVFAFDVQQLALDMTNERLNHAGITAELILDGHEHVDQYVSGEVKVAIFNLGYLPKSDKKLITRANTTLTALRKLLTMLSNKGRIAIMIYYGHEGGKMEKDAVLEFVSGLDQKQYQVYHYGAMNQVNQPPFLVMIEKLG